MEATDPVHETVNAVYLSDSRRVLATLIRLLGDFDVAEEALHDAFRAALEQWPRDGIPANPRAWLVSAGRFKAIDGMRRRARFDALDDVGDRADIAVDDTAAWADAESVEDEPRPDPGGASECTHRSAPRLTRRARTTALMRSRLPSSRMRRGWSYLAITS